MSLREAFETRLLPGDGSGGGRAQDQAAGAPDALARGASIARPASLAATLYVFWLLLSGYYTVFLMLAGLGCACAVVWFARRMDVIDGEGHPIHLGWRALSYWPWLAKEIATSAWTVARIIVNPALPVSPVIVELRPAQATDVGLAIHANSITLTPGTITLEVRPDRFVVHSLTREGAEGLARGEIDRRVAALEGRS